MWIIRCSERSVRRFCTINTNRTDEQETPYARCHRLTSKINSAMNIHVPKSI